MSQLGYSGTPLIKKLGIKLEMKILLIQGPGNYFNLLSESIADQIIVNNEVQDLVHLFAKEIAIFKKK